MVSPVVVESFLLVSLFRVNSFPLHISEIVKLFPADQFFPPAKSSDSVRIR